MAYTKRNDGRKFEESREIKAEVGVIKNAKGSAMFQIGNSIALAAVYGPKDLYPRFMQDPKKGKLRCYYDMISFSVNERKRPGPDRRSNEIGLVTEKSLTPVLSLENYPNSVVDVYIELPQTDAGTRCAAITAAAMALADARVILGPSERLFFMTGFLGALTTFSTYALESLLYAKSGAYGTVLLNLFVNHFFGIGLVFVGLWLGGRFVVGSGGAGH